MTDWSHQQRALDEIRGHFGNGFRSVVLVIPTGGGKTHSAGLMLSEAARHGNPSLFIADRRELVYQPARAFAKAGYPVGVVMADAGEDAQGVDWNRPDSLIQVCSKQTLATGRYPLARRPRLIVTDECHTSITPNYRDLVEQYGNIFEIGLTATPVRGDGRGLGLRYQKLVCPTTYAALQTQGVLVPVICKSPRAQVQTKDQGGQKPSSKSLIGDPVRWWKTFADGVKTFAFCRNVRESRGLRDEFRKHGIRAGHVDGTMKKADVDAELTKFRDGEITVITNCNMLKYGVDVPDAACLLINAPFGSFVDYRQACGRVMRAAPGKTHAIVIDLAGAVTYHDLPDVDFEWSLDGERSMDGERKQQIKDGKIPQLITCPKCYTSFRSRSTCPACNWEIPEKRGHLERNKNGVLVDVRRGDGRPNTLRSESDLGPAWRTALAIAANRGQTFKVAAAIFRGKAGPLVGSRPIESLGLDPFPKSHEWSKAVAEVFPSYVRRKTA